jgi:hypothetical protein
MGKLQAPNLSTGMILQECRSSAHSPFGGLVIEYQNNRYMMILLCGRYLSATRRVHLDVLWWSADPNDAA